MKIFLLFGSMQRGGAERVISLLANAFTTQGDQVSIITMDNVSSAYVLDSRVVHYRLNLAYRTRNVIEAAMRNIRTVLELRKTLKKGAPDVAYTFSLRIAVLLQLAFPFHRKFKIVASERANPRFSKVKRIEKTMLKLLLPKIDGFVFQTHRVMEVYPKTLQAKGIVIPNGVFSDVIPEKIPMFSNRAKNKICAIGRLAVQKGYDILLQAFFNFLCTHPGYELHIYGEGEQREYLEALAEKLNISKLVFLHGSIPDVISEILDAGMFVLASRFEGMPNALMEAMACGLPCVSTDCDYGPQELIQDGVNGILVPVEDVVALSKAMSQIADDSNFAEHLSRNAIKIRDTHNGKRISAQHYEYLKSVVNAHVAVCANESNILND